MLVLKKNNIPNLISRFKALNKSRIQVGYFQENGIHPSGLTFSGLYAIHAFGSASANIPQRDPLVDNFTIWNPLHKNITIKTQLKLYFSNIKSKTPRVKVTTMLSKIAGDYVQSTRVVFGDESKLTPNAAFTKYIKERSGKNPDSPLIWDGTLRDNLSYKINGQNIITP